MEYSYYTPSGGLPSQKDVKQDRAVFNASFVFIPRRVLTDIVTSYLPHWQQTRLWVLARPLSGFAETFSHYLMDVAPGGGSDRPDVDKSAEHILFVTKGEGRIQIADQNHHLSKGAYLYLPPETNWVLKNDSNTPLAFHWFRKRYQRVDGIDLPKVLITSDSAVESVPMPDTNGAWSTSRFVDPTDLRHDMHVNIVSFSPGGVIPFAETHVMEHGIYILCGSADYRFNEDIIQVEAGDYAWLRAFCPQCCTATGDGPFRYLLYKDVNRHMALDLGAR